MPQVATRIGGRMNAKLEIRFTEEDLKVLEIKSKAKGCSRSGLVRQTLIEAGILT